MIFSESRWALFSSNYLLWGQKVHLFFSEFSTVKKVKPRSLTEFKPKLTQRQISDALPKLKRIAKATRCGWNLDRAQTEAKTKHKMNRSWSKIEIVSRTEVKLANFRRTEAETKLKVIVYRSLTKCKAKRSWGGRVSVLFIHCRARFQFPANDNILRTGNFFFKSPNESFWT